MKDEFVDNRAVYKYAIMVFLISIPDVISYYATMANAIPLIFVRLSMSSVFLLLFHCTIRKHTSYKSYMLFCFFLMFLMSIINITPTMPVLTILSIGSLMILGTFHKPTSVFFFNKALTICAFAFTPILIWQLLKTGIDLDVLLRRGYAWTEIFAYATVTSMWIPLLFTSVLTKKNIFVALVFWLVSVIMGLISLKRQNIVDSFIAFSIILFVMSKMKDKKMVKRFLLLFVPLIVTLIIGLSSGMFSGVSEEVYDAMGNRFSETSEDVSSFDRLVESRDYFTKEASLFDIICGKGFLSAHYALADEHYFLHIGWMNFIFKGGLFLFFGILLGYKKVFKVISHPNDYTIDMVFCAMYCVFYFFACLYTNLMGFGVSLYLFFYCLTQINDSRNKKIITNVVAQ